MEHDVPRLARAVIVEYLGPRASDATVPELLRTTAPHTVRHFMRLFLRAAAQGREIASEDLILLDERARERAAEGIQFDQMLTAHQAMAAVLLADFQQRFRGDAAELGAFAALLQQAAGRAMAVSLRAFQEAAQAAVTEDPELLDELAEDLISGRPAVARAAVQGIRLPRDFTALALFVDQDTDERAATPGYRTAASNRKNRRVRAALAAELPHPLLATDQGAYVLVLAPGTVDRQQLHRIQGRISRAALAPVRLGAARAEDHGAVPAAARTAVEIVRTAAAFDLPDQVLELADVAVPWQLSRDTPAARLLTERFAPVLRNQDLAATLTAFVQNDFDRRRTAQAQAVHPNTVDNRLHRAARLCGADLTTSAGLLALAVALAHHRRTDAQPSSAQVFRDPA
ncbi:PucR family transcriptional regulator [Streptomyces sp. NPDC057694]|uniref:PucR family transcriptional regulator n=1 Tax=Streptomyces sp. NPDC057694 TaxID=3346216 RepID=UPI0036997F77